MEIELSKIRTDGGTQPRAETYADTVDDYAEEMGRGEKFPPVQVVFDGDQYWLVDGFHRVQAARQAGLEMIESELLQGTLTDAQWASYAVNAKHGERRTREDVQRAIRCALQHPLGCKMSDRAIAAHVHCDKKTVATQRARLATTGEIPQSITRMCADGREMNVGAIGGNRAASVAAMPVPSEPNVEGGDEDADDVIEAPEGGWPTPDDDGEYDSALAEPIFHNHKKAQACIQILQLESLRWKGSEEWIYSFRLTGVSGCECVEPLETRRGRRADSRADAIVSGAEDLAVHILGCLRNDDLPASRREALDVFLAWAVEQGADMDAARKELAAKDLQETNAFVADAEEISGGLIMLVDPRSRKARGERYEWGRLAAAFVGLAGDSDAYGQEDAAQVLANIDLIEEHLGQLAAGIRECAGAAI